MTHNVSPEGDGLGGKITLAELRAQFGESLPIEAAKILQTSPSPDDARAKLAALRTSPAVQHAAPNTIAAGQREAVSRVRALQTRDVHIGYDHSGCYIYEDYVSLRDVLAILAIQSPDAVDERGGSTNG